MKVTAKRSFAEMQWILKIRKSSNKKSLLNIVGGNLRYPPVDPDFPDSPPLPRGWD